VQIRYRSKKGKTKTMLQSRNTIAVPPGSSVREILEERQMTQKEFAIRMGLSEKHVSHLLNGKTELTQDVALRLESVLGVPAEYWNRLEAIYRERIERAVRENELDSDLEIARRFPYARMANLGWIEPTKDLKSRVLRLRSFCEVARLDLLDSLRIPGIAYRLAGTGDKHAYTVAAWSQKARIEARKTACAPIDLPALRRSIPELRLLAKHDLEEVYDRLISLLSDCGVAFVLLPHIDGSFLHGASFRDGGKVVLGMTVRDRDADKFWFSLMHELCHIICGHIDGGIEEEQAEQEADRFACDTLIPPEQYEKLLQRTIDTATIRSFARKIRTDPGIVVGRLQKEGVLPFNRCNELKRQIRFPFEIPSTGGVT